MRYEDSAHTLLASVNWKPSDKLDLTFGAAYSIAESEIEDVYFEHDPHTAGDRMDAATPWKGTYDLANTNSMESYSHLEYNILDLNLEATYSLTESMALTVKYLLTDVQDGQQYVYGDESGLYHSLRTWITYRF